MRAAIIALLVLASSPANAQGISALKQHDTKLPVDIDAQRIEVRDRENLALFQGDVKVRQGDLGLNAARVRVYFDRGPGDRITLLRVDAEGGVRLTSPTENATAAYGIYDVEERQLTMLGNVVLIRGESRVNGQRLEVNLINGVTTLDGGAQGGVTTTDSGRVSGRFAVPNRPPPNPVSQAQ
jgi:lipopolysaccharide export system protein LptA